MSDFLAVLDQKKARQTTSILLFSPGEAKGELEKRLANKGLGGRIVGIETVDKMTDRQIAGKSSTALSKISLLVQQSV